MEKFCFSWDTFSRSPFADMVCDLLVSGGDSSIVEEDFIRIHPPNDHDP